MAEPQPRRAWGWFSTGTFRAAVPPPVPPRGSLSRSLPELLLSFPIALFFPPLFPLFFYLFLKSFLNSFLFFFYYFFSLLYLMFSSFALWVQGYPASRKRPLSRANKYGSSQLRCIIPREIAGIPAPVYFGAEISHPSRSTGPCGAEAGRTPPDAGTPRPGSAQLHYRRAPGAEQGLIPTGEACRRQSSVSPWMEQAAGETRRAFFPPFFLVGESRRLGAKAQKLHTHPHAGLPRRQDPITMKLFPRCPVPDES